MALRTTASLLSPILYVIVTCVLIRYCWINSIINPHANPVANDITCYFHSHVLIRSLLLRCLGFMYIIVFSTALYQYDALWSDQGILPVSTYMNLLTKHANKRSQHWFGAFLLDTPTLLWFFDINQSANTLKLALYLGLVLSVFILIGCSHYLLLIAVWFIQLSLVNVGQRFMQYGWHPQFLEFAFLCIFLGDCNLNLLSTATQQHNPSFIIIFLLRWLIFRVMFEPGYGKIIGGDRSWWPDCTAMLYHYWTQPSPNVGAYFLHNLPNEILVWFTMSNHVIELILPFGIFLGYFKLFCWIRYLVAVVFIVFQLVLVCGGNYSYLSYLTMVQSLVIFDDEFFMQLFHVFEPQAFVHSVQSMLNESYIRYEASYSYFSFRFLFNAMWLILIMYLSHKPLKTVLSGKRASDYSFTNWHFVNGYGAFSYMTKDRHEIIILGSDDGQTWLEYGFKTKPDAVDKAPLAIAPIDWFLDWSLWFVPLSSSYKYHPWFLRLLYKILQGNQSVLALLGHNPFPEAPPQFLKVMKYRYRFGYAFGDKIKARSFWECFHRNHTWWKREAGQEVLPLLHLQHKLITKGVADDVWLKH